MRAGAVLLTALALAAEGGSRMTEACGRTLGRAAPRGQQGRPHARDHRPRPRQAGGDGRAERDHRARGDRLSGRPHSPTCPSTATPAWARPGSDGRTMDVIDIASRKRIATVDFGRPERPHCPMFGPDGRLYVTTELTNTITVIDPKTHEIVDRIPTGQPESHMVALTRDGKRAYTSNVHVGTVSAIDVKAKKVPGGDPRLVLRAAHRALRRRPLGLHRRPDGAAAGRDRHRHQQGQAVDRAARASPTGPRPRRTASSC